VDKTFKNLRKKYFENLEISKIKFKFATRLDLISVDQIIVVLTKSIRMNKLFTTAVLAAMALTAGSANASLRDDVLGEYSGSITGYEYLINYGSYSTFNYDGETNQYVKFEAGQGDDDLVITNLVPAEFTGVTLDAIPAKISAYESDDYKAVIEIQPQKVGTLVYWGYTYDAWIGASWDSTDYFSSPTEAVQFYVLNDGSIKTNITGWTLFMDYGGTFYSAINTGYDGDKLTPAGAATTTPADFDINDLVGDYTGSVTGYEYCAVYGSYNTFTYDGETHSYVNIARGEGENDIVFTNLVPSGYSYIQSSAIPATAYAYSEYEGYKGYIEIDPQKIGTITYYGYDYDAWIGADWSDGAYCYGPTAAAYFYVTDDGDIEMNSTGWSVFMDYSGTYYSGFTTGYDNDTLTKVVPEVAPFDRAALVGDYTGSITGYEYCAVYGSYNTYTYDGTENAYVNIALGEGENDIIFTNLIPSSYSYIQSSPITAQAYAYDEYDGYKGYIEIDPVKIGTITYYGYDYDAWIGADWSDGAYCYGPTASVYFYIANDDSIEMDFTGWNVFMDYSGTFYSGFTTGYNSDTLTKVTDSVKALDTEDNDAPAVYYNFNGVKVNGSNLTPGMYIKVQGNKATKILVK
jgi:hypothetical protein